VVVGLEGLFCGHDVAERECRRCLVFFSRQSYDMLCCASVKK
jgi:hypothetical protein